MIEDRRARPKTIGWRAERVAARDYADEDIDFYFAMTTSIPENAIETTYNDALNDELDDRPPALGD